MDTFWIPTLLLLASELLPFLDNEPNGIIHFLVLFVKAFRLVQQQEQEGIVENHIIPTVEVKNNENK